MDIHEIIHAWENTALPNDLDALAAIHNKVEDYRDQAAAGKKKAKMPIVKQFYIDQYILLNWVASDVEKKIHKQIPDDQGGASVP